MVFLNYSTMEMVAKIVYYGPGLGGKTTNLKTIYQKTSPQSRGEMVSLATETDRTLFFDLLPMEVGVIGGFKTKFQLYTVPGQVFYNTTRKLVLRGVDGIVFVADSQVPMMDANKESFQNLRDNLAELNLTVDEIPLVLQFNKRDLPNVLSLDAMQSALNPNGFPYVEASALNGIGVFETLREISKQTLMELNNRNLGKKKAERPAPAPAPEPQPPEPEAMPEAVSFDDAPAAPARKRGGTPKGARDSFEQTLDKMELDLSDDDDFLEDEDSLDMEEFDEWEEEDSLEGSLEDNTDDTSPGQIVTRELPDPITEPDALPTYDLDEADMMGDLVDGPMTLPDDLSAGGDDEEVPDLDLEADTSLDFDDGAALNSEENEVFALDDDRPSEPEDESMDLELDAAFATEADEPVADGDAFSIPEYDEDEFTMDHEGDLDLSQSGDTDLNEVDLSDSDLDDAADLSPTDLDDGVDLSDTGFDDGVDLTGTEFDEVDLSDDDEDTPPDLGLFGDAPTQPAEDILKLDSRALPDMDLDDDMDLEDSFSTTNEPRPLAVDPPPRAVEARPLPEPAKPAPAPASAAPSAPAAKAAPARPRIKAENSLDELKRLTTRIQTSKLGKKKDAGVNALLTDVLGGKEKKPKAEKHTVQLPADFDEAQLNCVFLDAAGNVVHTQLLQVAPRKLEEGRYQVRLTLDITLDD